MTSEPQRRAAPTALVDEPHSGFAAAAHQRSAGASSSGSAAAALPHSGAHSGAAAADAHVQRSAPASAHRRFASAALPVEATRATAAPATILVRILGAADGTPTPHDGRWLAEWNPHTEWGTLGLTSTADPAHAKRFPHTEEVFRQWRTTSLVQPLRPDGRPNKPLTAVSIEVHPYGS